MRHDEEAGRKSGFIERLEATEDRAGSGRRS
jgi:hypothetical protein